MRCRLLTYFFGASEKSLGNELTESCHVLVEGGPPWPLAEQILEPTTRSAATEQGTKSGKRTEWSRDMYLYKYIYF